MSHIAELNDLLRNSLDEKFGAVVLSPGVASRRLAVQISVREAVRSYDAFTPENDPDGEHAFGEFQLDQERYCWKIDCGDSLSALPLDPQSRRRRLTIMFAEEYWQLKSEQLCI